MNYNTVTSIDRSSDLYTAVGQSRLSEFRVNPFRGIGDYEQPHIVGTWKTVGSSLYTYTQSRSSSNTFGL